MHKGLTYVIGLMSGTSLDGIDLVYVKFENEGKDFSLLNYETVSYTEEWKLLLKNGITFSKERLVKLDVDYGKFLGKTIQQFIEKNAINKVDFIASHGHTIFHQPDEGFTLQIGDGQEIANATNCKVICDFRTQDVELGGQGAPLVPIGDELLFDDYDYCLNLGGFANVSFKKEKKRIAFDVCPVNIVMNHYTRKLGFEYDEDGKIAASGTVNEKLLEKLNALAFYKKDPPKSLGLEWVQDEVFPLIDRMEANEAIILRTFIRHSAIQIGKIFDKEKNILITGGGAYNKFLIKEIESEVAGEIQLPSKALIDFKEALIFAFLGYLKENDRVNCLQSVTGASKDHSSGKIFYPD